MHHARPIPSFCHSLRIYARNTTREHAIVCNRTLIRWAPIHAHSFASGMYWEKEKEKWSMHMMCCYVVASNTLTGTDEHSLHSTLQIASRLSPIVFVFSPCMRTHDSLLFIANSYLYSSNSFIQFRSIQIGTKMQLHCSLHGFVRSTTPKPAILILHSRETMNGFAANAYARFVSLSLAKLMMFINRTASIHRGEKIETIFMPLINHRKGNRVFETTSQISRPGANLRNKTEQ